MKKGLIVLLGLIFVVSMVSMGYAQQPGPTKVYNWRMQHTHPLSSPFYSNVTTRLVKEIEARTGGRVKITLFPGGQLVPPGETLDACSKGVFEMMGSVGLYWGGIVPEAFIEFGLPMVGKSRFETMTLFWERGLLQLSREAYGERNLFYLNVAPADGQVIHSKVPFSNLAGLRKLKVRAFGQYGKFMEKLGVKTVAVPYPELYSALATGVVDAAISGNGEYEEMRFNEVAPNMTFPPVVETITGHWMVNKKVWDELPADLKNIIDLCGYESASYSARYYHDLTDNVPKRLPKIKARAQYLPEKDVAEMQNVALKLWDEVGALNPRSAKMIGIIRDYMKFKGYLQ